MAIEITMPKLSDTMTEGVFACWKKNVGDRIERGDIIAEVETDKAVMELEAFAAGILIKTMVHGGETIPVGAVLGLIGEEGEAAVSTVSAAGQAIPPPETGPAPKETALKEEAEPAVSRMKVIHTEMEHEKASPLVRRLAREQGVDLERVKGSGPEGRITGDDLAAFVRRPGDEAAAAPSVNPPEVAPAVEGAAAPTTMRRAIANAVTESWQTIPHFSITVEINMDACREIVRELKGGPNPVGYNALVIKACACVLPNFPLLCSGVSGPSTGIHISFAVSKPDGVLMPVIRGCQGLSVAGIESESSSLADKSRAGRLASEEMSGGSFSVSNLGMYGVDEFTALIMPGQAAILAVGAVLERPVVQNGRLAAAATMRVTLSSDHRIVDGAYAASFLAELRSTLERPVSLLL